ncbi:MAG: winged helix-turn-helix transcriptional regulator [Devosia sp.]
MSAENTIDHSTCMSMAGILNRIGDKWTVMVVGRLARSSTLRFNELKRQINGVSQRMLTLTLRNLERDGLVTRTIYPEIPPRVEYSLTELGRSLKDPINALWDWSAENGAAVVEARAIYDARHAAPEDEPVRRSAYAR